MPYNARTTASDTLWTGVPVITCRGKSFARRLAASLLTAIGLPELIAEDFASYEALALRLARDNAFWGLVRKKLAGKRQTTPKFDANRFRPNIEKAYFTMVDGLFMKRPSASM